ncbi:uncharacterized protein LOC122649867 isoform X2 [Telopea speciosissima]|uniref:uncharacterized protein LOC122649867 isoform X2 n=1 Tax=Telopea speciosissima TaxID=54955 RepID=UPI001CC3ADF2|nr:uncharacterized protein LOC122649867 isoform X2 [Telopea speciosissima]
MDGSRNLASNTVGLCLLPSELIQDILMRLALPELSCLRSVCKLLTSIISGNDFRREFNVRSSSDSWLFVYKKRSTRASVLHGFTERSDRWFNIPIVKYLFPVIPPGEDLYFLTASGDFFLFASNNCRELIAVNPTTKTARKIPPSPLGPRGTSSWRRSGLKLIAGPSGSDSFRFLFAESYENRPVLFEYSSETDTWSSIDANESSEDREPRGSDRRRIFLSVVHRRRESVAIAVSETDGPVVVRPRFDGGGMEERLAIGFSASDEVHRLHVYGDGNMVIIRSTVVDEFAKVRMFTCIEMWRMTLDGRRWEFVSKVPNGLVERVRKPYGVMMGCLEEKDGKVNVILMSNHKGQWDLIWLSYYDLVGRDREGNWRWIPLPEFGMEGLNMAGIAFSSGLSLR